MNKGDILKVYIQNGLGTGAKGELQTVEVEAMNYEGSSIKGKLVTSKISVQPMVSLRDFEITLPVAYGSGPGHINE